jgi:hypothetical protein
MTPLKTCARLMTAFLALSTVLVTASALPSLPVAVPAVPGAPDLQGAAGAIALKQDIQTPIGSTSVGLKDQALAVCSDAAANLPVAAPMPLPVPVAVPDAKACAHADLNDLTAGADLAAGPAHLAADSTGQATVGAGPVQTHAQAPLDMILGWFRHLF